MQFEDRQDGKYRIYAGCMELHAGEGFLAAVVVDNSCAESASSRQVYSDTNVSGGHRFITSGQALAHALALGARAVAADRRRSAISHAVSTAHVSDGRQVEPANGS